MTSYREQGAQGKHLSGHTGERENTCRHAIPQGKQCFRKESIEVASLGSRTTRRPKLNSISLAL